VVKEIQVTVTLMKQLHPRCRACLAPIDQGDRTLVTRSGRKKHYHRACFDAVCN